VPNSDDQELTRRSIFVGAAALLVAGQPLYEPRAWCRSDRWLSLSIPKSLGWVLSAPCGFTVWGKL